MAENGEVVRAWFLLKLEGEGDRVELAKDIYCKINLNDEYTANSKVFVVRADLVDGAYDLVVPVTTESVEQFDNICELILGYVEKHRFSVQGGTPLILKVTNHVPYPPHKAPGYVTAAEENPLKRGPTGHNPW